MGHVKRIYQLALQWTDASLQGLCTHDNTVTANLSFTSNSWVAWFMQRFQRIKKKDPFLFQPNLLRPLVAFIFEFCHQFPSCGLWFSSERTIVKISQTRLIFKYTLCLANTLTTGSTYCRVLTRGLRAVVVCSVREHEIPQTTGLSLALQGNPS